MAVFPELIPSTRTYSPGAYPHTTHRVYNGSEARVRHSNTVLGVRLRLFFPAITTADLLLVIAHYNGQQGRFLPFAIPDELLSGTSTPADFTAAGHQWRYASRPSVEDIPVEGDTPSNVHNLTVELETVPPENTIVQGARLRVRTSIQGGSAQLGEFLEMYTTIEGGEAAPQVDLLATATLDGGSPFPVVDLDVVATLSGGEFIPPAEGLVATATLSGGAPSIFNTLTWTEPNTDNPGPNQYRLYSTGSLRLNTTSSEGYNATKLALLVPGTAFTVTANSVQHSCTVTSNAFQDAGLPTERHFIVCSVSPAFPNTTLSDTSAVVASSVF